MRSNREIKVACWLLFFGKCHLHYSICYRQAGGEGTSKLDWFALFFIVPCDSVQCGKLIRENVAQETSLSLYCN
jgi:hypothetical protein